jgi:cytoskeletal protein RodZ
LKSNYEHSREGIRSQTRSKRRKTNFILNGLIAIVLLLIIIVSVSIFSNNDAGDEKEIQKKTVENKVSQNDNNSEVKKDTAKEKATEKPKQSKSSKDEETTKKEQESDAAVVTEGGGDNVQKTIVDPTWDPIGTTQPGPNSNQDVDWNERVKALAYAIGTDESNMTVWYLSRNGQNAAIGTVTAKDNPGQAYRVYLEWKDSGGWAPVKVEELIENDKGQQSAAQ